MWQHNNRKCLTLITVVPTWTVLNPHSSRASPGGPYTHDASRWEWRPQMQLFVGSFCASAARGVCAYWCADWQDFDCCLALALLPHPRPIQYLTTCKYPAAGGTLPTHPDHSGPCKNCKVAATDEWGEKVEEINKEMKDHTDKKMNESEEEEMKRRWWESGVEEGNVSVMSVTQFNSWILL
jgi:hypothetical protein